MLGVFLDTETTGLDPYVHVPLELAFAVLDLRTGKELVSYQTLFHVSDEDWLARDLNAISISGLTRKNLEAGSTRTQVAKEVEALFSGYQILYNHAFFICQNPSFDRPFFSKIIPAYRQEALRWPYHWLDLASMYWSKVAARGSAETGVSLSKDSIASALGLPPEVRPHRAMQGVRHLILCYRQLVSFPEESNL